MAGEEGTPTASSSSEVAAESKTSASANGSAPDADGEKDKDVNQISDALKSTGPEQVDWADDDVDEDDNNEQGIDPNDDKARVEVLQRNQDTPYSAAASFEELGLQEPLLRGLYAMKFNKPSKIQATSLPMIFDAKRHNLIGQAHNGSGKTACFALGMLNQIDFSKPVTQALCVAPTRELVRQLGDTIKEIGKYTSVTVLEAIPMVRIARANEHVVVGTPGKIREFIQKRILDTRNVRVFVLDEADQMVSIQGFGAYTQRIKRSLPQNVQTLLFSATYADEVRQFAETIAPNANMITVKREQLTLDSITQFYFVSGSAANRFEVLSDIFASLTLGQTIIFVRTRRDAVDLTTRLRAENHTVSLLYGKDMEPAERDRVIDEFRSGTTKVLVTTNVLARGVDVLQVTVVINYDLPTDQYNQNADPETYMHRNGRTGRFGRRGVAINFVYDDASTRVLRQIESHFQHPIIKVKDVEELETRIRELK